MATIINLTPHEIIIYPRCTVCGGDPDFGHPGLAVQDRAQPGELGTCGDLHRFPQPVKISPSGTVARAATLVTPDGSIEVVGTAVPTTYTVLGPIEGLPPERSALVAGLVGGEEPALYIVSAVIASHPDARGRRDLLVPGEQVRDAAGRVIACRTLTRVL